MVSCAIAQRRHHYERAFEEFLRSRRIPYVAVDEARKALLPEGAPLRLHRTADAAPAEHGQALKSFDFVIYGEGANLLLDIKGRRVVPARRSGVVGSAGRLESWVTEDDIASLRHWEGLFGPGFQAAFVFVYWCDAQPPDALFQEVFCHRGEWYALRAVTVHDYAKAMKPRSARWRTVHVPTAAFERISQPFAPAPVTPAGDAGPDVPAFLPLDLTLASTASAPPPPNPRGALTGPIR